MDRSRQVFVVGATTFVIGGGLLLGRISGENARLEAVRERRRQEERARDEAEARRVARRSQPLDRVHVTRKSDGLLPGIGVCASEELTNCEVRYGEPQRTLVWRVARVAVPSRCENLEATAMAWCFRAGDGGLDDLARCLPSRGWFLASERAHSVLDLRETQTAPGRVSVQCDQGQTGGTFEGE